MTTNSGVIIDNLCYSTSKFIFLVFFNFSRTKLRVKHTQKGEKIMDLNVSNKSLSFGVRAQLAPVSPKPKMTQVSEKIQGLVKRASNGELLAGGTSVSAASEASLATKFPYIAAGIAALNSFVAGTMFTDARAVKKEIAGKDSLLKEANDKLVEQECIMDEKDARIEELEVENECLQEENSGLAQLLKKSFFERIFATALWSK